MLSMPTIFEETRIKKLYSTKNLAAMIIFILPTEGTTTPMKIFNLILLLSFTMYCLLKDTLFFCKPHYVYEFQLYAYNMLKILGSVVKATT